MKAFTSASVALFGLALFVALPTGYCTGYCHAPGGCPDYTVTSSNDKFETRTYAPTKWVSTTIEGGDFEDAMSVAFQRLFNYISTNNIEMTTPVATLVEGNKYTTSFFIPVANQASAPQPTDPTVFLQSKDPFTVYVYQYGGWSPRGTAALTDLADTFVSKVQEDGLAVKQGVYYSAGYNSPWSKPTGTTRSGCCQQMLPQSRPALATGACCCDSSRHVTKALPLEMCIFSRYFLQRRLFCSPPRCFQF
eukprot:jgi/Botrbrau1/17560/Bobra.0166s0008.1